MNTSDEKQQEENGGEVRSDSDSLETGATPNPEAVNLESSDSETTSAVESEDSATSEENAADVQPADETAAAADALPTGDPLDLDDDDLDGDYDEDEFEGEADPLEEISDEPEDDVEKSWYILKVQVNRENSICDALERRVKMHGLESQFGDILVPTEDIKEFTKTGKQRIVKRKLYPGYIVVHMAINDDTWFIVRETPGIGDFTGSAGKPAPLDDSEVERILKLSRPAEVDDPTGAHIVKNSFPFKVGDQVRVNEGNFQSLEGGVETIDESNGRITVMLNMFGRQTPVQLDHWQVEKV